MSLRDITITSILAGVFTPLCILSIAVVSAQMQSSSYRIESDSVNFAGGLSTSTNYNLESSAGEMATGDLGSTNFNLSAGYLQMVTTFISMSAPSNVTMLPAIAGITGGVADGETTVTVTTDSSAGYSLSISAEQSPSLTNGGDSMADYIPVGNPDFTFTTGSTDAHFGYSPEGVDVSERFLDNGGVCGVGSLETSLACWDGLDTAEEIVARRTSANTPNGSTTTINFRTGIGGSANQPEGTYTATTTLTALPL